MIGIFIRREIIEGILKFGDYTMSNQFMRMEEHELQMVELLKKLNLTRPVALTLTCLSSAGEVTSRYIELASGLRQPEVSIAMRYLCEHNWVSMREEKKTKGKGRPMKLYKLVVPLDDIISAIEEEILMEKKRVLENIRRLKKFV